MSTDKLIYSLNNIKDEYIIEYSQMTKQVTSFHQLQQWLKSVACLIIIISIVAILLFPLTKSEIDDPKGGINYEFSSYSEFCEILPPKNLLSNLPNSENADIKCSGVYSGKTDNHSKYEEYTYLFVNVNYDAEKHININCTINSEKKAREYVNTKPLTYPPNSTNTTKISDTEIFYTYNEELGVCFASLSIDNDLYEIQYSTKNTNELINFIKNILSPDTNK